MGKLKFVIALAVGYLAGRRSRRGEGWLGQVRANRDTNRQLHDPSDEVRE